MPLRPDFTQHRPDSRLNAYRDRVGRLFRSSVEVGLVLVTVEPFSEQVGGHLFWRRWGETRDVLWVWTLVDGAYCDSLVPEAASDEEIADYEAGHFTYLGETLDVVWTDPSESEQLRASQFGM